MTKSDLYAAYVAIAQQLSTKPKAASSFSSKQAIIDATEQLRAKLPKAQPKFSKRQPNAGKRPSVSGRCQELILAGRALDEVWSTVKAEFQLDDAKKHYPAWNRAMLIRTGRLAA